MNVTSPSTRLVPFLGLTLILLGCSNERPVIEPPPLEVVISQPARQKIVDWDNYTGTVEAKESVDVRARVRGEIKEVCFKEGDEIAAGAKLFVLDSDPFKADLKQAEGELATWDAKLKFAEEKIKLYQPLANKGTVSKEELLQAVSLKAEAIGGIDASKGKINQAEVNITYCQITSKIAGRVGQALLTKGNIVNAGSTENLLTTVVSVDPMYVYFSVNERALLNYRRILSDTAAKAPEGSKDDMPAIPVELARVGDAGYPFKGIIDFVDNRVDPATGAIKVRASFDNPKGPGGQRALTAGLFARIRVAIAEPYPAILAADRAILTDQNLKYVLVVNKSKNNTVERLDITASNRLQPDCLRAVQAGLKGDEWIIVEGVNRARPGITVNPKDAPMARCPAGTN